MTDNTQTPSSLFPSGGPQSNPSQEALPSTLFPNPKSGAPLSGPYADVYFSHGIPGFSDVGSVMSHIGQGASEAWGANINSLPKAADQALTKAGLYNDHTKNENNYFKAWNEEFVRPVINTVLPLGAGLLGGLQGAFQGVGEALQTKAKQSDEAFGSTLNPLSATLGEAGEYIGSVPERVPELPMVAGAAKSISELTAEARSKAVVGEGEQGFFNTKPVSEENLQARSQAAEQAGQEAPTPEPPQMDVHQVVRQMDPVLFQEVDRLNEIKATALESRTYAQSQDIADVQRDLTVAQTSGRTDQVQGLTNRLGELQSGVLGPKALIAHATYEDADGKLRDLIPEVGSAYKHAQEIMMTPEEIAAESKLADLRLQQLNDKIETDGLTKEEWNEYNILNKAQEEKVSQTGEEANPQEQSSSKPGVVRMYHGGSMYHKGYPLWFTSHLPKARGYVEKGGGKVQYIDLAEDHPLIKPEWADQSVKNGFTVERELPAELADLRKPLEENIDKSFEPREGGLKTLSPEAGPSKIGKGARDINQAAIDKGISRGFKDQSQFTSTTEEYQKTGVKNLLQNDYEGAVAIALGQKEHPSDLLPGVIFDAVKAQAQADGDINLMMKLAKAPLASHSSKLGQALGMADSFDETNPTDLIKHVEDSRAAVNKKKVSRTVSKQLQDVRNKTEEKMKMKDTWKDWLDSIPECEE